ncbi:Bcp1p [Saccharomyces cerevisiae x Saccharomyces kudriavzevii VIN7]|uniref:Protein BCP1 n=1 Tax=Saccharomyces cerevisiae x Saccharomyces kudriavzevii (strain VIN7) TaxID=1095631 RepID=H0GT82_SACCK|nr:Bcp1p [Saccharomyces cerevisiae x Saccharomyces kudriavzevii VIN7]
MEQVIKLNDLKNRKRRNTEEEEENGTDESEIDISSTDSEDEEERNVEEEIVNIDFDFFGGNPDVDFHALKNLSRQLFGPQESTRIQLSSLADLILGSPTTTIKTDGKESDPYCFLSFVDFKANRNSDYAKYLQKVDMRLSTFFKTINDSGNKNCALVISERLINMPPEVVPPLYKITLEDVTAALGDDKHYDFYVIVTRKYEVNFDTDDDAGSGKKDKNRDERSKKRVKADEVDYFHEEDRFFEKHAKIHFESEAKRGVISSYMILDHEGLVKGINELESEISTW